MAAKNAKMHEEGMKWVNHGWARMDTDRAEGSWLDRD